MLAIVLESQPHDLYALGGSTEPVVAPQWIHVGQAKKFKSLLFARGAPNTVPAPVPYSRERLVARGGYHCHLQMVLWTCGPPGARTTGRVETCEFRKLIELSTAIASRIACPNSTCPCSDKFASALRASIACNAGFAIDDSAVMNTVLMAALPLPLPLAWEPG